MLENGVLHVNYQQVQVMSAIRWWTLADGPATAGESQGPAACSAQGQLLAARTGVQSRVSCSAINTDTFKLIYENKFITKPSGS